MPRPNGERLPRNIIKEAWSVYWESDMTIAETARKYGTSASTLHRRFRKLGLKRKQKGAIPGKKRRAPEDMPPVVRESGWTYKLIGGTYDGESYQGVDPQAGQHDVLIDVGKGKIEVYGIGRIDEEDLMVQAVFKEVREARE